MARSWLVAVALLVACGSRPVKPLVLAGRLLVEPSPITGEVLIGTDGKIACVAESCASAKGYADAVKLALGDAVISPGLIDAHQHVSSQTVGPQDHGSSRYQHRHDWRIGAEGATALPMVASTDDRATLVAAEVRSVIGGVTSIISGDGVRGLARNLSTDDWSQLEGLAGKPGTFKTFPLGDNDGPLLESGCGYPKVITHDQAFGAGAFAPHIGEGINAAARNELTCLSALVTSRTALIQAIALNAKDADLLHQAGASVIWSPRSNLSLYGDTAPVALYHALGIPIALGTDWLPSGSMNLLREVACVRSFDGTYLGGTFSNVELWKMVAANAADAIGLGGELGYLREGLQGDVTVFAGTGDHQVVFTSGVEDIKLVLRGGHPLYGDATLVDALQKGCATLDVCGRPSAVCLDDTGVELKAVQDAAAKTYPLFFCKGTTPDHEPTCRPSRESYPNGVTPQDQDGDGIDDAADDCPMVFNPVRPMDGASQADVDGDGAGDVCDAAPLDATRH